MKTPTRSVEEALAAGVAQIKRPTQNWGGLCLEFVRKCWGLPTTDTPDAISGWRKSKKRHTTGTPRRGSLIYLSGPGRHGHVMLAYGGDDALSNDFERDDKIDIVSITAVKRRWGGYLGWTEDYCGAYQLPLGGTGAGGGGGTVGKIVDLSQLIKAAKSDPGRRQGGTTSGSVDDVKIVEGALRREGLLAKAYAGDGSFGTLTVRAYSSWQRRCGYRGRDADGIPGSSSLKKLAKEYGFGVKA